MRLINEQQILENWSPVMEELGVSDPVKKGWLSRYAHYHQLNESVGATGLLNESFGYSSTASLGNVNGMGAVRPGSAPAGPTGFYTGTTGSGDKFPSLLPLAIQVAARTVGFDIVPVIPMSGPTGVLTYLDYVYAGGKLGSESKPMIIQIAASDINSTKYTVGTKYWGVSAASSGSNFASGDKAVEMIFVAYSRIDGYPIFRIGDTYKTTDSSSTWALDSTVTLREVFDLSSVIVTDNSGVPQKDNASGTTIAVTAKATLVKALEDHIQGYAGAGTYDQDDYTGSYVNGTASANPMGRATGENTYYRSMNMQAYTKFVEAETFQVAISLTTEQIQDLNKQHGIDVLSMAEGALIEQISQSINKHILSRAFALGWSNNEEMLRSDALTLNFTIDSTQSSAGTSPGYINKAGTAKTLAFNAYQNLGSFENLHTIQRRVMSKIIFAGNIVANRGRRGPANFVVTNAQIATALQDTAQFSFAPMANTINQNNGSLYPVGSIAGMTVYVDPNMSFSDNRVLVGRKGGDEEPGLKFCPYLMAESIQTISENTMSPKLAVKSRYALIEAGQQPQTMYYTFYIHFGAVPLIA